MIDGIRAECVFCGSQVPDGSDHCPSCGSSMTSPGAQQDIPAVRAENTGPPGAASLVIGAMGIAVGIMFILGSLPFYIEAFALYLTLILWGIIGLAVTKDNGTAATFGRILCMGTMVLGILGLTGFFEL